jgi:hypothetical protein
MINLINKNRCKDIWRTWTRWDILKQPRNGRRTTCLTRFDGHPKMSWTFGSCLGMFSWATIQSLWRREFAYTLVLLKYGSARQSQEAKMSLRTETFLVTNVQFLGTPLGQTTGYLSTFLFCYKWGYLRLDMTNTEYWRLCLRKWYATEKTN